MCMCTLAQIMCPCTYLPPSVYMCRGLVLVTSKLYSKPLKVTKRSEETWFECWVLLNINLLLTVISIPCFSNDPCIRMLCVLLCTAQL